MDKSKRKRTPWGEVDRWWSGFLFPRPFHYEAAVPVEEAARRLETLRDSSQGHRCVRAVLEPAEEERRIFRLSLFRRGPKDNPNLKPQNRVAIAAVLRAKEIDGQPASALDGEAFLAPASVSLTLVTQVFVAIAAGFVLTVAEFPELVLAIALMFAFWAGLVWIRLFNDRSAALQWVETVFKGDDQS